jgi:hypothetical protein
MVISWRFLSISSGYFGFARFKHSNYKYYHDLSVPNPKMPICGKHWANTCVTKCLNTSPFPMAFLRKKGLLLHLFFKKRCIGFCLFPRVTQSGTFGPGPLKRLGLARSINVYITIPVPNNLYPNESDEKMRPNFIRGQKEWVRTLF